MSDFATVSDVREVATLFAVDTGHYLEASVLRLMSDKLILDELATRLGYEKIHGWAETNSGWERIC